MIVAFKHMAHDNDLIDTFISLLTISQFIHCQIIFSNGKVGSSWPETGVALRPYKDVCTYPFLFTYIETEGIDEQKTYKHLKSNIGKKFDMIGSLYANFYIPLFNRENKYHCSELCYESLKKGGLDSDKKEAWVSPQTLFNVLVEKGNKVYTVSPTNNEYKNCECR